MNVRSFMGARSLRAIIYPILAVMILSAVSLRLQLYDASLGATVRRWYKYDPWSKVLWEYVVKAPVLEELYFRGPSYVFLLGSLFAAWWYNRKTGRTLFIERTVDGAPIYIVIAWVLAIAGTYIWAATDHPYPLPTFGMGIILAAIMMKTRNILWSMGAHAFINICVVLSAKLNWSLLF